MYRRLRLRLTAVCAVSTGLVLVVMAAAALYYSVRQLRQQSAEAFESNLNSVLFYLRGQPVIDHTWLSRTETANGLLIRVDISGEALTYTALSPLREALTGQAAETALLEHGFDFLHRPSGTLQPDVLSFRMEAHGREYRAAAASVPSGDNWYSVIVLKDTVQEKAQRTRLALIFASCVLAALVCLAAVAWRFTEWAVRPVEEGRRRQNEFISAASHELRSPLAVIKASLGAMKKAPPQKAAQFSELVEKECDRLTRLTADLLQLAGADSRRLSVQFEETEPETVLLSASERFEDIAVQSGVRLSVHLPDKALPRIYCDQQRLEQLMGILIENAIRHTPPGGQIRCAACRRRQAVRLSVADSGCGVPDAEKELVFQRFYQGDRSRTQKEHYGLGLSIAKEIAQLHRGTLAVADSELGGAEFVLSIPLRKSETR